MKKQPEQSAQGQPTAQELYHQSMSLINDAIQSCGIDGFEPAPLAIPQVISHDQFNGAQIPQTNQNVFFAQAQGLFGEQGALFGEQESLFTEPEPEPESNAQAQPNDAPPDVMAGGMPGVVADPNVQAEAAVQNGMEQPNADENLEAINSLLGMG